ncbi:Protein trichome birefringence-like 38 [Linum perenne]
MVVWLSCLTCFLALVSGVDGRSNADAHCSNPYDGIWVLDKTYNPLYNSSTCPFVRKEFDCLKYGRLDHHYLHYRWKPSGGCILPRFNGKKFLRKMRGKKIMFVGDSVSMNQYESLLCMLHASVPPNSNVTSVTQPMPTVTFEAHNLSIMLFTSHYLVDVIETKIGAVLDLNSIGSGTLWKQMDVLVFNSGLWWYRTGPSQGWDYIQNGKTISKDMNRMTAFSIGMKTWARWVDLSVDTAKTTIFFQGVSPVQYNCYRGVEWGDPGVTNCRKETRPISGPTRPYTTLALKVQEEVIATIKKPVHFLNITSLSFMRKDGHPSYHNGLRRMDCTHWCLAGVPDTWNQLLSSILIP